MLKHDWHRPPARSALAEPPGRALLSRCHLWSLQTQTATGPSAAYEFRGKGEVCSEISSFAHVGPDSFRSGMPRSCYSARLLRQGGQPRAVARSHAQGRAAAQQPRKAAVLPSREQTNGGFKHQTTYFGIVGVSRFHFSCPAASHLALDSCY